jgi:hypothetical protein
MNESDNQTVSISGNNGGANSGENIFQIDIEEEMQKSYLD